MLSILMMAEHAVPGARDRPCGNPRTNFHGVSKRALNVALKRSLSLSSGVHIAIVK